MIGKRFATLCATAVIAAALPAAGEDCPPFPTVALWGDMTHASAREHVNSTLAGDWNAYVGELQRQLDTLRKFHARNSGVAVTRAGRTVDLRGEALAQYIAHANRRLAVARCLAGNAETQTVATFSTAAGTSTAASDDSLQRTYLQLPESVLDQLRKIAVRQSVKEGRQVSVSEVAADLLERELKRRH